MSSSPMTRKTATEKETDSLIYIQTYPIKTLKLEATMYIQEFMDKKQTNTFKAIYKINN